MRDIWIFYSRCTITFIFTQLLVAASCCHLLHYVNKVHIVLKIKDNLKSYPQYVHKNQGKQVENNFKYWFPNSLENSKVLFQNINRIRKFMIRSEERRSWFKILVLEKINLLRLRQNHRMSRFSNEDWGQNVVSSGLLHPEYFYISALIPFGQR